MLRFDDFASGTDELQNIIAVVAVVPTLSETQSEVDRLSAINADKDCRYFWTSTRYYPSGRSARYDLNLWIGHPLEGAAYLPR